MTSVLFLVRFNNFGLSMGFYWLHALTLVARSYVLLDKYIASLLQQSTITFTRLSGNSGHCHLRGGTWGLFYVGGDNVETEPVLAKLAHCCQPCWNILFKIYRFNPHTQEPGEKYHQYCTVLWKLSEFETITQKKSSKTDLCLASKMTRWGATILWI